MIKPFKFIDYEKISDDILYLGSKTVLRMNVVLTKKDEQDNRISFHKEYMYSTKYSPNKVITLRRSFDYFLTLEKVDIRENIMIRLQDMIIFQRKIQAILSWFESDTFATKNNSLLVYKRHKEILEGLALNKWIMFEPVVITWENTGEQTPGVRMTLSDNNIYADIIIDKIYALSYILNTFNMYQAAITLLNYLQRPEYGYNLTEFDNSTSLLEQPVDHLEKAKEGRQIPTKPTSWFDRLDRL